MGDVSFQGIEASESLEVWRECVTHVPGLFCYPSPWTEPIPA